jgi:hypothetical protein
LALPVYQNQFTPSYPSSVFRRLSAAALVVIALGIPINDLPRYALLVVAAVAIFTGTISARRNAWLGAIATVTACVIGQVLFAPAQIEEGENVFLIDRGGGALARGLPPAVFEFMAAEFNAKYPPEHRCDPAVVGCWRGQTFPENPFGFSADGIYQRPAYSRRVSHIDFSDPIWLRLGFINEQGYNWNSRVSDVDRASRDSRFWQFLHRWRLEMPWFVVYRFPAAFKGSALCWRGQVLWEGAGETFEPILHSSMQCHRIAADDIGRRIFGVAIKNEPPLAIKLEPTAKRTVRQLVASMFALLGAAAVLFLLVQRGRERTAVLALALVAATLVVAFFDNASFIGGVRPFDSGDDGLVFDGFARAMLRQLLDGNILGALEGGENVFYFTPGMRYLRVVEHLIFGETYLGYLSLMLLLPFFVFAIFRRFLPPEWAVASVVIFAAIPIGVLFGSSLVQYVKWAARGFGDPAAYTLFLAALGLLIRPVQAGQAPAFAPALGAGLLFALALFVRPNIAPATAVLLTASALAALWQRQYARLAGLVIGFLPVLGMLLHNWFYGGALFLFTATAQHPGALVTPPSVYIAALAELVRFDLSGEHLARAIRQIGGWLAGPSESVVMAPVNAAALFIVARMLLRRSADSWLRIVAGATLVQQMVGAFYAPAGRYYYLTWLLTALVTCVWLHDEGLPAFRRRFPGAAKRISTHPAVRVLARAVHEVTALLDLEQTPRGVIPAEATRAPTSPAQGECPARAP